MSLLFRLHQWISNRASLLNNAFYSFDVYKYRWNRLLTNVTSLTTFTTQLVFFLCFPQKIWVYRAILTKQNKQFVAYADINVCESSNDANLSNFPEQ